MTRTVLLHCPNSAEIRTVDNQLDLRILYSYNYNINRSDFETQRQMAGHLSSHKPVDLMR